MLYKLHFFNFLWDDHAAADRSKNGKKCYHSQHHSWQQSRRCRSSHANLHEHPTHSLHPTVTCQLLLVLFLPQSWKTDEDGNGCVQTLLWGRVWKSRANASCKDKPLHLLCVYSSHPSYCALSRNIATMTRTAARTVVIFRSEKEALPSLGKDIPFAPTGVGRCKSFLHVGLPLWTYKFYSFDWLQVIDASKSVDPSGQKCRSCSRITWNPGRPAPAQAKETGTPYVCALLDSIDSLYEWVCVQVPSSCIS